MSINDVNENKEIVIEANNLGVSFVEGFKKDDFKSHIINLVRNKKKKKVKSVAWPLKDINFKAYKGEVVGIIGSNGAGKTTLCKLITGILQPNKGSITVKGKVSALFALGMGFNKELTGRDNVYLNGMMLGISKEKINEYIDEIHEFSGIGRFLDEPMKNYSSGMKARLGFSVAAFLEPEILILDEALNTGDREFSQKAAIKIKELISMAKMVIIVTHSLNYAQENCDRIIWLDKGMVRDIGESKSIIEKYKETIPERKPKKKPKLELVKTNTEIKDSLIVKAENVSVSFKVRKERFWALKKVSFEVKEGEVIGIIGHNGAGKSTLCKLLTKILTPEEGKLTLKGKTSALLGYGTGFNAQLSGIDNIYLNGMLLGIPKERVERDLSKIIEFSELGNAINKPVKQYSSGMRSRLGFSIAATLQPDIFIIDEALSTGDVAFQNKASVKIQEMMEKAKAVIIVTHSMSFVEKVCTRAIWMEKGEKKFDGDPLIAVEMYKEHIDTKNKK
ncbi:ABC transporter ATP-binding protein [Bacillus sp. FJAT-45066]|uniref:ABC transporter ATP-binding protein n=1 Tax=Bacillus sp. FJAT-45066 TaxID=2011010 RepID=UPI000BB99F65|nr:ABC transporter ATP-binding protein [Bacillus sp. FJAT-45066]